MSFLLQEIYNRLPNLDWQTVAQTIHVTKTLEEVNLKIQEKEKEVGELKEAKIRLQKDCPHAWIQMPNPAGEITEHSCLICGAEE